MALGPVMLNRLLLAFYLISMCVGGIVALSGVVIFIEAKPGDKPMGLAGILLGLGTVGTGWLCFPTRRQRS